MFLRKRGVSPLIATILLLAFAVALATVIIQFLEPLNSCAGDEVTINTQKACFDSRTKNIKIFIENKDLPIIGLSVAVEGSKNVPPSVEITQDIKKSEPGVVIVPYDQTANGNIDQIMITAKLNKTNTIIDCPLKQKIIQVPVCLE
jgi:flagellin-like protein